MAFAAGAGSRLVGVARYSELPPGAPSLPEVGDAVSVDLERIVGLRPDLVLAWQSGNRTGDYERLEKLGYPVFVAEPRRLGDVARALRAIGALAGTRPAAERAAADFERGIGQLRERYAKAPRVRAFYVIWTRPYMTVSGAHMISDVISLCGGENVFGDVAQLTPTVSLEAIIAARPEVILGGGSAGGEDAFRRDWRAAAPAPMNALPALLRRSGPDTAPDAADTGRGEGGLRRAGQSPNESPGRQAPLNPDAARRFDSARSSGRSSAVIFLLSAGGRGR